LRRCVDKGGEGRSLPRAIDHKDLVVRIVATFVGTQPGAAANRYRVDDAIGRRVDDLNRVDVTNVNECGVGNDVEAVGTRLVVVRADTCGPCVASREASEDLLDQLFSCGVDDVDRFIVSISEVEAAVRGIHGADVEGEVRPRRYVRYLNVRLEFREHVSVPTASAAHKKKTRKLRGQLPSRNYSLPCSFVSQTTLF
jgi:hypothetical protein